MIVDGQSTSLAELAAQGRTTISPDPAEREDPRARRARPRSWSRRCRSRAATMTPLFAALESRVLAYFAGSLAVHLGIWAAARSRSRSTTRGTNIDLASLEDTVDAHQQHVAGRSAAAAARGQAGRRRGRVGWHRHGDGARRRQDGQEGLGPRRGPVQDAEERRTDPQLARQQAIEQARNAGILGSTALTQGGAFASLTGTGDISSGFDDTNIYGGLLGNEAGEMNGGFGFGRSGFGPGGGGTGWGTIGTGRYGTIGHGSGTGSGYGVGGGRGGMRGRTAAVPTVSIGQPNAQRRSRQGDHPPLHQAQHPEDHVLLREAAAREAGPRRARCRRSSSSRRTAPSPRRTARASIPRSRAASPTSSRASSSRSRRAAAACR